MEATKQENERKGETNLSNPKHGQFFIEAGNKNLLSIMFLRPQDIVEPVLDTGQRLGARLQIPHKISLRASNKTRNARS